jgi:hypothetical protein
MLNWKMTENTKKGTCEGNCPGIYLPTMGMEVLRKTSNLSGDQLSEAIIEPMISRI